jgi:glyoxylase-like metal-dependent hydrolase (beta-lactamase superfamily II)
MQKIVEGIYRIEELPASHVYLIAAEDGLALVDTGTGSAYEKITAQMEANGFDPAEIKTIFLTHAHGDHIGSAIELVKLSGAETAAHEAEAPYFAGESMPSSLLLRIMGLVGKLFPQSPTFTIDRTLADGEMIDQFGGLQVIHTPGHTPGCMCLYLPEKRVLFTGDIMTHKKGQDDEAHLWTPMPPFTADMAQAKESIRKLAELDVEVICPSHYQPILQGGREKIRALVEKLDRE